jgi:hypothetical protein
MDVLNPRLGLLMQLAGAIAIVAGFGVWLGAAAALLVGGIGLIILGVLVELSPPEPREEVTLDEGTGPTD